MAELYPLGIQSFPRLISENRVYVDKTEHLYRLAREGSGIAYFLSRPGCFLCQKLIFQNWA